MKTAVIFYSFTGKTKAVAQKKAAEFSADLIEIKNAKKRGKFSAYTIGCFQAMKGKKVDIMPVAADLSGYDKIIIIMPIWASCPAPPFNNVIEMLPKGKPIELIMTSGSGKSDKERTIARVKANGCEVVGYTDIKS